MDEPKEQEGQTPDPADTQAERTALAKRIKAFWSATEKPRAKREARYNAIDKFHVERDHWQGDEDGLKPAIPLSFYHVDSLAADIGKRPHNPKVVAEEAATFPGDWSGIEQWTQTKEMLRQLLKERYTERADNELAADFFSALLDYYREKACIDPQRATARLIKLQYGDVYWHNGYDPELALWGKCPHFVDLYTPKKVTADPKATRWIGNDYNGKFCFLEVETTLRDLRKEYPDSPEVKEIVATEDKTNTDDQGLDPLDQTVKKYLVWIADDSTEEIQEEYTEEQPVIIDGQMVPQLDETGMPVVDPETGEMLPMMETVVKTRPVTVPKYPSGWMLAVWCQDKVLDFGPADEFSLHRDFCYEVAGQVYAMGVVDVVMTFNVQANQFYDQIIKNSERTGDNLVFLRTDGGLAKPGELLDGKATVVLVEGPLADNVMVTQGVPASDGLFRALDLNLKLAEQIVGNIDPMSQENLPRTASGKYVYAAESGQQARISRVAEHGDEAERSLLRSIIRQSLKYDDQEINLKVKINGQQVDVPLIPNSLYTHDFDMRWDVVLDAAPTESPDPGERNEQRKGLIAELSQMPKTIAMGTLDRLDVPDKEAIRVTLDQWYREQDEAAANQPAGDPVEIAKANGQAAKDFTQSMQDASKALQDSGMVREAVGLMLWAVMESRKIAAGQDPDFSFVSQLFTSIGLPAPIQQQQMVDPMADPMMQQNSLPPAPGMDSGLAGLGM